MYVCILSMDMYMYVCVCMYAQSYVCFFIHLIPMWEGKKEKYLFGRQSYTSTLLIYTKRDDSFKRKIFVKIMNIVVTYHLCFNLESIVTSKVKMSQNEASCLVDIWSYLILKFIWDLSSSVKAQGEASKSCVGHWFQTCASNQSALFHQAALARTTKRVLSYNFGVLRRYHVKFVSRPLF